MTAITFEKFQASRQEMSAKRFGEIVQDGAWDDEPDTTRLLVYLDAWYIDILEDGRHQLTIENMGWITDQDITLEDLERKLYEYASDFLE